MKEERKAEKKTISIVDNDSVFHNVPGHIKRYWRNMIRGSSIGTLIGALPGAGADIAAWISYGVGKGRSKESANMAPVI